MTQAVSGFGAVVKRGDGASPEVFTAISEVMNPNFNRSFGVVDVTHHQSTGRAREKIATLHDSQLTFDVNLLPVDHANLENDHQARTLRNFQFDVPDEASGTKTYQFSALVSTLNSSHPVDGKLSASVTLDISGQVTEV